MDKDADSAIENPWQTLESQTIYSDPWIRVRVDDVLRPDKSPGKYSVVELKGGIGVVALNDKDQILLVGQFRYAVDKYSWEIPKGAFPDFNYKRDPIDTAKQELEEEAGIVGMEWSYLGHVHTLLGSTNDEVHLFKVRQLSNVNSHPEATEVLQLQWVNETQFWEMVDSGEITDATSIAGLALCRRKG